MANTINKKTYLFDEGEVLQNCSFDAIPKETTPPSRYKEATLLKALEDAGIGRPSTRPGIIELIKSESRGYCEIENKTFLKPTEKGIRLVHYLENNFNDLVNEGYTREMENSLDLIANGKLGYKTFLKEFIDHLEESASKVDPQAQAAGKKCPKCGGELVMRKGKYGPFLGCKNWPKCTYIEQMKKKS